MACSFAALGQDLNEIVVTGSRSGWHDLSETPAISITKPGDFLLQKVRLVNDTRDDKARHEEIYDTIAAMLSRKGSAIQIAHGEEYLTTLDQANYKIEIDEEDEKKRADVSFVELYIKVPIANDAARAEALTRELKDFIKDVPRKGRTEINSEEETALSLVSPDKYRYELIEKIAADARKISETLGGKCKIGVKGLEGRIQWARASVSELLLYIPYAMEVGECGT